MLAFSQSGDHSSQGSFANHRNPTTDPTSQIEGAGVLPYVTECSVCNSDLLKEQVVYVDQPLIPLTRFKRSDRTRKTSKSIAPSPQRWALLGYSATSILYVDW